MSQTATTQRQPGWWARRRLDRLRVAEEAALSTARIKEATARSDASVADVQRRNDGKQRLEADSHRAADQQREKDETWRKRAARLTKVAAMVAGFSLAVTAAGQVMFYTSLPWSGAYRVIAFVLFTFIEGPAWYFALNSRDLADRGRDYAWSARRVWVFALLAAVMNSYHGAQFFGRWDMGVMLGAPSLIGPYVWHKHVHRLEILATNRTLVDVRAAVWRRIHHPLLSWRANRLWAETGGRTRKDRAFLIVFYQRHGHFPGALDLGQQGASPVEIQRADSAAADGPASTEPPATGAASQRLADDLERYLQGLDNTADSDGSPALNGSAGSGHLPSSAVVSAAGGSAGHAADLAVVPSADNGRPRRPVQQRSRRLGQRAGRPPRGDSRGAVERYVREQLAAGTPLDSITGPVVAKALDIAPSTARNLLAELKPSLAG